MLLNVINLPSLQKKKKKKKIPPKTVIVVDRVAALDTAGSHMDSVAVERDRALAFPAVAHRTRDDTLLVEEEP